MVLKRNQSLFVGFCISILILIGTGCQKNNQDTKTQNKIYSLFSKIDQEVKGASPQIQPPMIQKSYTQQQPIQNTYHQSPLQPQTMTPSNTTELDFTLLNETGKRIYVVCFSYIQKHYTSRWRWDKSQVYKLEPQEQTTIDIDTIDNPSIRNKIYGYMGVFHSLKEAKESIFELLPDGKKVDLDLLWNIKGKMVSIATEKYGFKEDILEAKSDKHGITKKPFELDFVVKNETGKPKIIVGFVYQRKDDIQNIWRFDKTPHIKLNPGEEGWIDVDTIVEKRNRTYTRGFLGIFDVGQEQIVENITYELLPPKNKVKLGQLKKLSNKKVIIKNEEYGIEGELIDFSIKPIRRIYPIVEAQSAISNPQPQYKSTVEQTQEISFQQSPPEEYSYAPTATMQQPIAYQPQPAPVAPLYYAPQPAPAYGYAPTATAQGYYPVPQPQPVQYSYARSVTAAAPRYRQINYEEPLYEAPVQTARYNYPEAARISRQPQIEYQQNQPIEKRKENVEKKKKKPFYKLFFK
jgi:hypothetical protein